MKYHRTEPEDWPKPKPRRKGCLADMSEDMQTALIHCAGRGVSPDEFGTEGRWSAATRRALVAHGLIHLSKTRKGREVWRPTDDGRGVVAAHIPRLLMPIGRPLRSQVPPNDPRESGYTTDPREALHGEPEAA